MVTTLDEVDLKALNGQLNGAKLFKHDESTLGKIMKSINRAEISLIQYRNTIYGHILDMSNHAREDAEYYELLKSKYGKAAHRNTMDNPAAFLVADEAIIKVSGGYETKLRKMYIAAYSLGLTGDGLIEKLDELSVNEFVEKYYVSHNPKEPKTKPNTAKTSPASITVSSKSGGVAPTLFSKFTKELYLGGKFLQKSIKIPALIDISGPVTIIGHSERGYFTPTRVIISPMTIEHTAVGENEGQSAGDPEDKKQTEQAVKRPTRAVKIAGAKPAHHGVAPTHSHRPMDVQAGSVELAKISVPKQTEAAAQV